MEPKTFRRREHRARATRTAVDAFTGPVLEHLRERMRAVGFEGEISPECFADLQETLTSFVEASLDRLESSVGERHALLHEALELRTRRDEAFQELYSTLVALRHTVRGAFGQTMEHELFGTGKTPRDPVILVRLGHALAGKLTQQETRERLSHGRVRFDWDETVDELTKKTARLRDALHELTANASGQSTAVSKKDEAVREHDRTQRGMFKVLEGLYEMAGMDYLADKLRPIEPARRGSKASAQEPARPEAVAPRTPDAQTPEESRAPIRNPSPVPLRIVASGFHDVEPRPDFAGSAPRDGFRDSAPPGVAKPPGRATSAPRAASAPPVRTSSDPPGGASHRARRSSEPATGGLPVV